MSARGVVALSPEVADILTRSSVDDRVLFLPKGQLARPLYEAVDKALKALGGKWNRKLGGHLFERDPNEALSAALASGSVLDRKRALEQFWTPPDLVRRMCSLAGNLEGADVLEPSAGMGHILFEIIGRGGWPVAVELDRELAVQLESEVEGKWPIIAADFLSWRPRGPETTELFDVVLMNPPFSRNQDIAHVRRAYDLLKPYGQLVAITSPHWTFAQDRQSRDFHEWIRTVPGTYWEKLPDGTFKESGTGVGSILLKLCKGAC